MFDLLGHLLHEPAHDLVGDDVLVVAVDMDGRLQARVLVGYHRPHEGSPRQVGLCVGNLSPRSWRRHGLAQLHTPGVVRQRIVELDGVMAACMNAQLWHARRLPQSPRRSLASIRPAPGAAAPPTICVRWSAGPRQEDTGRSRLRLHVDKKAATQLSIPQLLSKTNGHTEIESKKAMRARGLKSPDRAESVLLSIYEPEPLHRPRHRGLLN